MVGQFLVTKHSACNTIALCMEQQYSALSWPSSSMTVRWWVWILHSHLPSSCPRQWGPSLPSLPSLHRPTNAWTRSGKSLLSLVISWQLIHYSIDMPSSFLFRVSNSMSTSDDYLLSKQLKNVQLFHHTRDDSQHEQPLPSQHHLVNGLMEWNA